MPCQPWPQTFFASRYLINNDVIELRPLTATGIIRAVARNFITMSYHRALYLLFKAGFLDAPEGSALSMGYFRLKFWKARKYR